MKRIAFFLLLITLFLLTACTPQPQVQDADVAAASPTATATPTSEPTFTSTPTATFTPTPIPTATFTPTPTPITLPVRNGTAVPDLPYEVITTENVHRLREVARYGYARLLYQNPYRLTADGKTIAAGTTTGIEFYDAATHQKTGGFEIDLLHQFDMTPDGKFILALAGDSLSVWTAEGELVREFSLEVGSNWSSLPGASLSPDGSLLAVQRQKADWQAADKVDVYRVSDGTLLDTVRGMGAQFSPDGKYLATVFDSSVRLYPMAELGEGWEKRLPKDTLPWCGVLEGRCNLFFSPDGTLAAVVRYARVDVHRVADRRLTRQVSGWMAADYNLPQVFFTPDGSKVLIQTPEVRKERSIEIAVYPQAILVDIASGEWLTRTEVVKGAAHLVGGEVRTFVWEAEGEMPHGIKWMHPSITVESDGSTRLYVTDWWNLGWGQDAVTYYCQNETCSVVRGRDKVIFYDDGERQYEFRKSADGSSASVSPVTGDFQVTVPVSDWIFGYVINSRYLLWSVSYSQSNGQSLIFDLHNGKLILKSYYQIHPDYFYTQDNLLFFSNLTGTDFIVFDLEKQKKLSVSEQKEIGGIEQYPRIQGFPMLQQRNLLIKPFYNGVISTLCVISGNECVPFIPSEVMTAGLDPNGHFLATYGDDGFIRVWAVVPQDSPVR